MYRYTRTISKEGNPLFFPALNRTASCGCGFTAGTSSAKTESISMPDDSEGGDGVPLRKPVESQFVIKDVTSPLPRANTEIKMTPYHAHWSRTTYYPFYGRSLRAYVGNERRQGWNGGAQNLTCLRAGVPWYSDEYHYTYDETAWEVRDALNFRLQPIDLRKEINRVMGDTITKANHSWDALTDLAELKSSLQLAANLLSRAQRPLSWMKSLIEEASKSGGSRRILSSEWLQFQYGIMPIVFSIQDIFKTLEERDAVYATARSKSVVQDNRSSFGDAVKGTPKSGRSFYQVNNLTYTIRGTGKVRYSGVTSRLIDRLGFNPLRTAWDLTRFSLVIDWFYDVSTALTALGARINLNSSAKFCYSVKTTGSTSRYAYRPADLGITMIPESNGVVDFFCDKIQKSYIKLNVPLETGIFETNQLSSVSEIREYQRVLFSPDDYGLMFDARVSSIRRQLSALALAVVTFKI